VIPDNVTHTGEGPAHRWAGSDTVANVVQKESHLPYFNEAGTQKSEYLYGISRC
jgi:hypothetical protein